jgi:hypothetical protein
VHRTSASACPHGRIRQGHLVQRAPRGRLRLPPDAKCTGIKVLCTTGFAMGLAHCPKRYAQVAQISLQFPYSAGVTGFSAKLAGGRTRHTIRVFDRRESHGRVCCHSAGSSKGSSRIPSSCPSRRRRGPQRYPPRRDRAPARDRRRARHRGARPRLTQELPSEGPPQSRVAPPTRPTRVARSTSRRWSSCRDSPGNCSSEAGTPWPRSALWADTAPANAGSGEGRGW